MRPENEQTSVGVYGARAVYRELPDSDQTAAGVIPLDTLPAPWWNAMWHQMTLNNNRIKVALDALYDEVIGVLTAAGITADSTKSNQLQTAIAKIGASIATATEPGSVKSSSDIKSVSVGTDGTMLVNALTDWTGTNTIKTRIEEHATATAYGRVKLTTSGWGLSSADGAVRTVSASTTAAGIVQLNDAVNSTSTSQAATANAVKKAYDLANGKYSAAAATKDVRGLVKLTTSGWGLSSADGAVRTVSASTTAAGIVQLNDAVNSTSTSQAATANAVKKAYDLANGKWTHASATAATATADGTRGTVQAPKGSQNKFLRGDMTWVALTSVPAPGTSSTTLRCLVAGSSGGMSWNSFPSASLTSSWSLAGHTLTLSDHLPGTVCSHVHLKTYVPKLDDSCVTLAVVVPATYSGTTSYGFPSAIAPGGSPMGQLSTIGFNGSGYPVIFFPSGTNSHSLLLHSYTSDDHNTDVVTFSTVDSARMWTMYSDNKGASLLMPYVVEYINAKTLSFTPNSTDVGKLFCFILSSSSTHTAILNVVKPSSTTITAIAIDASAGNIKTVDAVKHTATLKYLATTDYQAVMPILVFVVGI